MDDASAQTLSSVNAVQSALSILTAMQLTTFRYPPNCPPTNGTKYDYIIVGSGSAGSVLAYRLSANTKYNVLLLEAGDYPPFESEIPLMFPAIPRMSVDYDTWSVNDSYTAQNLQDNIVSLTQGKMIGGSSNLGHMIHVQGDPQDYNNWASILDDDSWTYENILPYFKKLENLTDPNLRATSYANLHGTDGMMKIEREISDLNCYYCDGTPVQRPNPVTVKITPCVVILPRFCGGSR